MVKTRLAEAVGPEAAASLARAMLLDLVGEHQGREYDLIVSCNKGQSGHMREVIPVTTIVETEGTELRGPSSILLRLFDTLLTRYERVIAVCADTPFVVCARVRHAFALLSDSDLVVGPGVSGGYYLIGMRRLIDVFSDHRAGRYPYLGQTLARAEALGVAYRIVPPEWDIDTIDDIRSAPWEESGNNIEHTLRVLRDLGLAN
jgi:glycosyltransferase A (GT-A) superfamily protein (DUF2064 family)